MHTFSPETVTADQYPLCMATVRPTKLAGFVALVALVALVGCVPAPTRMVVVGDSHASVSGSWPQAIDCMDVDNRSISGAGLGTSIWMPSLVDRLDSALDGVGQSDMVIVALGSNDFGSRTVAQMQADKTTVDAAIAERGAHVRWATTPPISPAHPYRWYQPWFSTMIAHHDEWNAFIRRGGGADIYLPLGSSLDAAEDRGDHVHLSPAAHYVTSLKAKELLCQ